MKVLFLSAWFPFPPDNGSRIRAYNLMKALSRKHEVVLVSLLQDDSDPARAQEAGDMCRIVSLHPSRWFRPGSVRSLLGYFSRRPRSVVDTYDPEIAAAVRAAVDSVRPDVIVASTLGVVEYVPRDIGVPCVLEEHNCEYAVLKRSTAESDSCVRWMSKTLGWRKFARWEADICRRFDAVSMVSEQDAEHILAVAPDILQPAVVPNGVDTDHYADTPRNASPNLLIYNGALTYNANLDAVRYYASDIYPLLQLQCPEVKLQVTGRTDGVDLAGIRECKGIELVGYVDDIRTVLGKSAVCVVPLRAGGGSRLKILEAMAAGVPVVSTSVGAEGIVAENGRHLLIADTPQEFADCVARVIRDQDLAAQLSGNARSMVKTRYDWSVIGEQFVRLVESVGTGKKI